MGFNSQGQSDFDEAVYVLPLSPEISGAHFIDLWGMKDWPNLGPPSGFEHGTTELEILHLNH